MRNGMFGSERLAGLSFQQYSISISIDYVAKAVSSAEYRAQMLGSY